jgi:DNA-binding MarR family transcriptional regulator/GNAT superfamily N-acetyltransferase
MEDATATIRRFNRFFTLFVGALDANFLSTGMSLAEARLLYEIAMRDGSVAIDLQGALKMDAGFVSRVLRRFEQQGLVERGRSSRDARRRPIELTSAGREAFALLNERQKEEVRAILSGLDGPDQCRLSIALSTAQDLLEGRRPKRFNVRSFRPGDMGLIVSRQAVLYHEVYGWNSAIEANEAEVTANFLKGFKPGREQCWIAEVDGRMAGSIFVTDEGEGASRLRLLYVEPWAQGLGIGSTLVRTSLSFARDVGYDRMSLWTHSILEAARSIYAREGFRLVSTLEHDTFGPMLTGETWELDLRATPAGSTH